MRKILAIALLCMVYSSADAATKISYNEEMFALGTISGQGLACKSQKYHKFEMLARAIVVGKAKNAAERKSGMQSYNEGKATSFMAIEGANFADCEQTRAAFDKQKIFDSTLYSDGRVKLYDGTMITPYKKYDASKLYVKDREAFIKADAAYKKYLAEAQEMGQNVEKVPLVDANYQKFANEFGK